MRAYPLGVNLILIGLRGSGKTTVGRLVADLLGLEFTDLDAITPGLMGVASVREAWDKFGQAAFREAEARALTAALAIDSRVLSLGGGTPTAPGAADTLRTAAKKDAIIYLRAGIPRLAARLAAADMHHRPAITDGDPISEIERVRGERDPLYQSLATLVVDVDDLTPEAAADLIIAELG